MNKQTIFIIVIIIFFNLLLLNIFRLQNEIYNLKSNKILPGLLNENMYNFKNIDSNSNVNKMTICSTPSHHPIPPAPSSP